jgi:hypothetical protein
MTKPSYKEIITTAVISQLPQGFEQPIEEAIKSWWFTGANSDVLRLSEKGDVHFRIAQIEFYQYEFTPKAEDSYYKYMSDLGKKMRCPYFLGVNKVEGKKSKPYIRLYDSKIAMMVSLYGNLDSYLKSIKVRK